MPISPVAPDEFVSKRVATSCQQAGQSHARCGAVTLVLAAMLGLMPAAQAQVRRNGNIYDFTSHQPTRSGVANRERREGDAPPPAQARSEQRAVNQLDRKLLRQERMNPPAAAAPR